jgi:DNA-binding response OmpR family regulator
MKAEDLDAGPWDVLCVDDEQVVCDSIRLVLGASGMRVAVARDVGSALVHPALAGCKLLICDLMLPDRHGTELIRALRSTRPRVPVVAITGFATTIHNAQALAAGATDFLAKPFDDQELTEVVERALDRTAAGFPEPEENRP